MTYALMLTPHPNLRYRASLEALGTAELTICLRSIGLEPEIRLETLGGARFLLFEAPELSPEKWGEISRLSGVCWFAMLAGGQLTPAAPAPAGSFLQEDLPALLKYKGKTNESFTRMLLNLALWNSQVQGSAQVTVLDPMCGKGTGPLSALLYGFDAVGVEIDKRDIKELNDYFTRYLEYHHIKHKKQIGTRTLRGRPAAQETTYAFARDAEAMKAGESRSLRLLVGDTLAQGMLPPRMAQVLICDLPYGVQHAPSADKKKGGLPELLEAAAPAWFAALTPGAGVALSFNSYTLRREAVRGKLENAGFEVRREGPYDQLEHWVEQAINRDVVVAQKPL